LPAVSTAFRTSSGLPRIAVLQDWCVLLAATVLPITVAVAAHDTAHVSRVTIVNPTPFGLEILASTPNDATLTLVTLIAPGDTVDAVEFIDRGQTWVLHIQGDGYDALPVEVDRADFIDLGRPYAIPDSVGQQIADQQHSTTRT